MTAPPSIDRLTFLEYLQKSGLVDAANFDTISSRHTDVTRGKVMARKLVDEGVLTRYQAERLLAGQTTGFLLGQYRILDQVGKGGMGRVFKAEHRTMRRIVALKLLTGAMLKTDRAIELFLHEIRAVAVLQHPNIVSAYDANAEGGRYYLVLEYVDGPNLHELVQQQGPLPVGLACDYIRQAANGLQFAHQLKMVHRDVKPANILVQKHGLSGEGSPGLVKISDFGLARLAEPAISHPGMEASPATLFTRDNSVMGTPDYLSPEQSRNLHNTDIRSDLYSLGCTFYYLLTGQVPYPGGTALEKLIRHATETPKPLGAFREDVSVEVNAIYERLTAKHPDERFQTPGEVAQELEPLAVTGVTPWSRPVARAVGFGVPPGTSLGELPGDPGNEYPMQSSDHELAALESTVSSGMTDPDAPASLVTLMKRARREQTRVGFAVIVAVALAAGALTLLALIGLLAGGR
jgi:serine/threonine protein kinase